MVLPGLSVRAPRSCGFNSSHHVATIPFDYIIDDAEDQEEILKTFSTVCKRWAVRSRAHLFRYIYFSDPSDPNLWCKAIPPITDGPSNYVESLHFYLNAVLLIHKPQSSDPYLNHFSAFTHLVTLTLAGYRGKVHLDTIFSIFQERSS